MRICHLGKYYPPAPGGIETHLQTLARAQAGMALDVQVLCMQHEGGATAHEMDGAVRVTRFKPMASVYKLQLCPELVTALCNIDADILHLHVPNPAMIVALILAQPDVPLIVTYHSDIVRQRVLRFFFSPLERLLYTQVRRILPTSPGYSAGSKFLVPYRSRIHVVPMGLNLEPYCNPSAQDLQKAAELTRSYPGPIWLACGRLIYYKGLTNAIRAMVQVPGTLLIIGDGPERDALKAETKSLNLTERVKFMGYLPTYLDIVPYYYAAHALWFPSNARSEAFGLVQVEAMACGCPVINTDIPDSGVSWVSVHDKTGLTVPRDDPGALATAANRLYGEPGLRQRLGVHAKERAQQEFDHSVMALRYLEVYRRELLPMNGGRDGHFR